MKVVILAGGAGTYLIERAGVRPKSLVEIGGWPILWHLMKIYSKYGFNEFIICCGNKGETIKKFFADYAMRSSDVTFDFRTGITHCHTNHAETWKVTLVDTGENTMTGGRMKRIAKYVAGETFCCTYGDCLCDVDIGRLVAFHRAEGRLGTLLAVQPPGRFGAFTLSKDDPRIGDFREKPRGDGAWVNGGFFVLEPEVLDYIDDDSTVWEQEPMQRLSEKGQLSGYRHEGFWHAMDTLRDMLILQNMWQGGRAPWREAAPCSVAHPAVFHPISPMS